MRVRINVSAVDTADHFFLNEKARISRTSHSNI